MCCTSTSYYIFKDLLRLWCLHNARLLLLKATIPTKHQSGVQIKRIVPSRLQNKRPAHSFEVHPVGKHVMCITYRKICNELHVNTPCFDTHCVDIKISGFKIEHPRSSTFQLWRLKPYVVCSICLHYH